MNTAAIATKLNVLESAIVRIEEWAHVLFVVAKGVGARFVSKKIGVDKMGKLNVHYVGSLLLLEGVDFLLTCRTLDGKKAYGLDCKKAFEYKDYLKSLGFKWDAADKAWYTVNADIDNIFKLINEITAFVDENMTMGIEDGFLNQSKVNNYLIANCASNAVANNYAK